MKRREFISLLGAMTASVPRLGQAQERAAVRIGFLRQAGPHQKQFDAFREGLRAAGYVEGQNIVIEQRYAAGAYDRLSALATELVRSNVDVIVVDGTAAAKACKDATASIPIVFALAVDPVADGLAKSFAEPGGNLTGLTMTVGYGLAAKRRSWVIQPIRLMPPTCVRWNGLRPRSVSSCTYLKREPLPICLAPSARWWIGAPAAWSAFRTPCCLLNAIGS